MISKTLSAVLISTLLGASGVARAHVTVVPASAVAGAYTKVVLQVPHGCAGSATRVVSVHVPPELLVAKPMPKAGWTVTVQKARLAVPVKLHGRAIEETTSVIRWEGGPLPADFFDEFALYGKLGDGASGTVAFKTVQTCEKGELAWSGDAASETPAPLMRIEPTNAKAPHHAH